jgi:hypothetical protein
VDDGVRREDPRRYAVSTITDAGPKAVPVARWIKPGRAARSEERKLQERRLDERGHRGAQMAAIPRPVICQDWDKRMTDKTNNALTPMANQPRRPPVRVRLRRVNANLAKNYPPDGESKAWWKRLKKALGTTSSDFVNASLFQLQAAARLPGSGICEMAVNAALAMIEAAAPKDEIEGALAVQMACTHSAAMAILARLGGGGGSEHEWRRLARPRLDCCEPTQPRSRFCDGYVMVGISTCGSSISTSATVGRPSSEM